MLIIVIVKIVYDSYEYRKIQVKFTKANNNKLDIMMKLPKAVDIIIYKC